MYVCSFISGSLCHSSSFASSVRSFQKMNFPETKIFKRERCNIRRKLDRIETVELNTNKPKNEHVTILDMHPGLVVFSDIAQKMKPIAVEGLEHITGVLGYIEDGTPKSTENDDENQRNTGTPCDGALLWAHIALYSEGNAKHFDCSECRGEQHVIQLLDSTTLPGILIACRSLRPGQRGQFILPPHTMYGEFGCPPTVPKSCTVLMILFSFKWIDVMASQRYAELNEVDKRNFSANLNLIQSIDEAAANEFQTKKYKPALSYYESLYEILQNSEINSDNYSKINFYKIKTMVNVALCQVMLNKPFIALSALDEAVGFGDCKNNCKYLFTRGKCHLMMFQYENAYKFLMAALNLEPNNIQIADELLKLDPIITKHRKEEKSLFKNMLTNVDSSSNFTINEDTENSVRKLCKQIIDMKYSYFPLPRFLIKEEEDVLNSIVDTIDNVEIVSRTRNNEVEKHFAITECK